MRFRFIHIRVTKCTTVSCGASSALCFATSPPRISHSGTYWPMPVCDFIRLTCMLILHKFIYFTLENYYDAWIFSYLYSYVICSWFTLLFSYNAFTLHLRILIFAWIYSLWATCLHMCTNERRLDNSECRTWANADMHTHKHTAHTAYTCTHIRKYIWHIWKVQSAVCSWFSLRYSYDTLHVQTKGHSKSAMARGGTRGHHQQHSLPSDSHRSGKSYSRR